MKKIFKVVSILLLIGLFLFVLYIIYSIKNPPEKTYSPSDYVKSSLTSIRAQAVIVYNESVPRSYETVCNNETVLELLKRARKGATSIKCFNDNDSFVVSAAYKNPTNEKTHFCVDSTGAAGEITSEEYTKITDSNTLC